VNFISNMSADAFVFVSAEGSGPVGSPVRAAGGLTGLVGYETQSGAYLAGIPAVGMLYGGAGTYYGHLAGVEFGLGCHGLTQQNIDMQDVALELGLDVGGGKYTAGPEAGYFGYFGLGALGEDAVLGVGVGAGPPTQNYIQPWGGAL
jgi:hypothetical protein